MMDSNPESLNLLWSTIADQKLKLKNSITFHKHCYRGIDSYVICDGLSNQQFRCSQEIQQVLAQMDGTLTTAQILEQIISNDNTAAALDYSQITQALSYLILKMSGAELLHENPFETQNDNTHKRCGQPEPNKIWYKQLIRPFAIRIPLLNPDTLLDKLVPFAQPFYRRATFGAWLVLVLYALLSSFSAWPELSDHWQTRFLDPKNLVLIWFLYPLVKGLHELGHALTIKVWGERVYEIGIMLLVFMPLPYVDASSSAKFSSKQRRFTVAAIGIAIELALASICFLIWQMLEPGLLKDTCFNVAFICSVSTLLINGNPLLRFDGYYALSELVEIPNLGTRSNQYVGYLLKRHIFKLQNCAIPATMPGEKKWLVSFCLLSGIYRIFISLSIALFIAAKFFIFGVLLAIWAIIYQLLQPAYRNIYGLFQQAAQEGLSKRTYQIIGGSSALLFAILFLMPFSSTSTARGVLLMPEQAYIRANSDGFVRAIHKQSGSSVSPGETLISLENDELTVELKAIEARRREAEARYNLSMEQDTLDASILKQELVTLESEHSELLRQINALDLTSNSSGKFIAARENDLPGRFVKKGDLLAYVVTPQNLAVRVAVDQNDANFLKDNAAAFEIRLASDIATALEASEFKEVPSASNKLPSKLLGSQAGGAIAVDATDEQGLTAIDKVFQFDLTLPQTLTAPLPGQTATVRIAFPSETLAQKWSRIVKNVINHQINNARPV